jgi:sterol 3beta-glucosyltransferase
LSLAGDQSCCYAASPGVRVHILAIGSRGDVQPYVALALGFQAAGHQVRLVTLGGFDTLVRGRGLDHVEICGSARAIVDATAGSTWRENRQGPLRFMLGFLRVANAMAYRGMIDCWTACQSADVLVASPIGVALAYHVAEKLTIPLIRTSWAPSEPSRYDWRGRVTLQSLVGRQSKILTQAVLRQMLWLGVRSSTNQARRQILGLPMLDWRQPDAALRGQKFPLLDGYSPAVVPRPPDWGDWIHVTGYWFLPRHAGWCPPNELVAFLGAGPPPVYVGFGAPREVTSRATRSLVLEALAQAGQRGVVLDSTTGPSPTTDQVYFVEDVPFDWLFPNVAAVVHHGGAGTTAAGLRAGVPSAIVPRFEDQPFWGQRVWELGVGPRPVSPRQLSVRRLAATIRAATSDVDMRQRAAALGERIRGENGVANAISIVEQYAASDTMWRSGESVC